LAEVTLDRSEHVATLVIQRQRALNSLDEATLLELRSHVAELRRSPARVVLVRTAGERVFAAGADIA
jgi:enoyl-CoA hydratase/carnithine racemase